MRKRQDLCHLDHRARDRDQDQRQVRTHDPYTYGYESALVLPQLNRGRPSVTKQFGLKKFAGIVVVVVVVVVAGTLSLLTLRIRCAQGGMKRSFSHIRFSSSFSFLPSHPLHLPQL